LRSSSGLMAIITGTSLAGRRALVLPAVQVS
jgi:hypothetical protein